MLDYVNKRNSVDAIRIVGMCRSACGVFLSHPNVCVSRKAKLGLHALSKNGEIASDEIQRSFATMLGSKALGEWFLENASHSTKLAPRIGGAELIKTYGFKECKK